MKFKDWINYDFSQTEIIVGASAIDHLDTPVEHPIGIAPQIWNDFDLNLLNKKENINENLCYSNIHPRNEWHCRFIPNERRRETILRKINRFNFISKGGLSSGQRQAIPFNDYFINLQNHKFSISPEGNGIDCHRHYETILAKGIPIIQKPNEEYSNKRWGVSSHMEKFEDLPVLWTEDYSELTSDYLEEKFDEFLETEFDFLKMTKSYWRKLSPGIDRCMNYWTKKFK